MKRRDLTTLAMIGVSAGLVVGGCQNNDKNGRHHNNNQADAKHMNPDMESFYASLSPSAKEKFKDLDAQHKMMALEMADQKCNGQNKCAGMGGCATADNACAGENGCKGQGGAPVKNPNKAVEIQYKNQHNSHS